MSLVYLNKLYFYLNILIVINYYKSLLNIYNCLLNSEFVFTIYNETYKFIWIRLYIFCYRYLTF